MVLLTLVRHGQASYLEPPYDRLTALGEAQMLQLARYWLRHDVRFDRVLRGPAERHRQSEQIVAEVFRSAGRSWPQAVVVEDWDEFPAEAIVHRFLPELLAQVPRLRDVHEAFRSSQAPEHKRALLDELLMEVARRWARGELHHETIESWQAFHQRVRRALEHIRQECSPAAHVAVFTSAGPMAAALAAAYRIPLPETMELAFAIFNSAIAQFELDGSLLAVWAFNCCPHLEDPQSMTRR